ncbi:DUF4054 domain-containing protein [Candidatus Saccharibacteria bacterium]|nr:DUF4054 domain-containing protein [Candidatus Saccharibacteria bacterium]
MEFGEYIEITVEDFRNDFPEFKDLEKYPNNLVEQFLLQATCYISDRNCGIVRNRCRKLAIELMVAHLITIYSKTADSQGMAVTGVVTGATIDMVNLSFQPPPLSTAWKAWILSTPYGQRYYALLMAKAPAPFYMFGTRQRLFRM